MSLCEAARSQSLRKAAAYCWLWFCSGFVFCGISVLQASEPTWEYAVQVSAAVQSSPARITLTWPQDVVGTPSSYVVYRKAPGATSWGTGTTLPGTTTTYVDNTVAVGTSYEYQLVKNASGYTGY